MSSSKISAKIDLKDNAYEVIVGKGILNDCGNYISNLEIGNKCAIISDSNVAPLYASKVSESLANNNIKSELIVVDAGESSKSLESVEKICRKMIKTGHDRHVFVIALGGGVIGDLAGLVASVFYRGVPFIQIPTTIVSQVDSAVGGKTGVNTPEGKNLIGSFYHPKIVITDTITLSSLPEREFNEGFAEVIKHAAIRDKSMFEDIMSVEGYENLDELILRNVEIKARIVEQDEKELSGLRAHLNYGHTIGHAIETAGEYGKFLHGEAISLGLIAANKISSQKSNLSDSENEIIIKALKKFNLPTQLDNSVSTQNLIDIMKSDKKFKNGKIRFVILNKLGEAELSEDISEDDISLAIEALRP